MNDKVRSPLKDKPLRNPGQSAEEARQKLFEDKLEQPLLFAMVFLVMAFLEWWRSYTNAPPKPWLFTVLFFVVAVFCVWRLVRIRPKLRALRQGAAGEKAVGQYLERLRSDGYEVFHDVIGEGFNVDHVAIGPAGAFTIETKTWSKPIRGEPRIDFDGETLRAAGFEPDRDPIVQAKAQAKWLQRLMQESSGRTVTVRPVVVFPGWFVKQAEGSTRDVWDAGAKGASRLSCARGKSSQ